MGWPNIRKVKKRKEREITSRRNRPKAIIVKVEETFQWIETYKILMKGKQMDADNFILKFDFNYQNLFIHNSNDEEAHAECFQATVETTCASEIKKVYPAIRKQVETIGGVKN